MAVLGAAAGREGAAAHHRRSRAFWAANSSSVRTPWSLSSASSLICAIGSTAGGGPAPRRGGRVDGGRRRGRRRGRFVVAVLGLVLLGPAVGLAPGDAVADGRGRSGDGGGAGDPSEQSGHGSS